MSLPNYKTNLIYKRKGQNKIKVRIQKDQILLTSVRSSTNHLRLTTSTTPRIHPNNYWASTRIWKYPRMIKCRHAVKFKKVLSQEEASQYKKNRCMTSNLKDLRLKISTLTWILPAPRAFWNCMIRDLLPLKRYLKTKFTL